MSDLIAENGELVETTGGRDIRLRIQLEGFEGPLDLLLHLIRKHELDILDIPIAFVTEEYLRYLDAMQDLDLAIAGEYLVMAATLIQIKSATLLPKPEEDEIIDDLDAVDPREALIRRLLEYQRYKDAAVRLESNPVLGRDVFTRPSRAREYVREADPAELLPVGVFELLDAFRRMLEKAPEAHMHVVTREELSLRDTINGIAERLAQTPRMTLLDLLYALDTEPSRQRIVVTFCALLELAKMRMVRLFQAALSSDDLIVERAVVDIEEVSQTLELDEADEAQ